MSTGLYSCLVWLEIVLGSFYHHLATSLRFGSILGLGLFFVVPTISAQQISRGEELLAPDGTLIPDFTRAARQEEASELEEPGLTPAVPTAANRPGADPSQDPLDRAYAAQSSEAIDRRANQRLNNPPNTLLPTPLEQAPRNFREDDWLQRDENAFDPLGIRTGGFVLYPELYSRLISNNNLFASSDNQKSDVALEITPTFRLRSDWNVHELEFFVTGTKTSWRHFTSENTTQYEARVRGRLDITARTSVEAGVRYEMNMEGRGSTELADAAIGPSKTHETELFGQVNHRFNRLGFRLRGQVIRNTFDDVALTGGGEQDNEVRDYDESTLNLRTNYEFSPRFSLFADTQIGARKFEQRLDGDGLLQGSNSWLAAIGTRVELTSNLSFLGNIGYARANPDEPSLTDLEGVVYDASLIWNPFRFTTITLNGQTEIEETTQSGSPGSLNRSVSVEITKGWTHRLSSTLSAEYEVRDFAGISDEDTEFSFGLVAEYLFSRSWVLDAGIVHTKVNGTSTYSEDEIHLGLKWRR